VKHRNIIFLILLLIALTVSVCHAQDNDNGEVDNGEVAIITTVQAVWFAGSFVGIIVRLALPILRKKEQINREGWKHKYTTTTVLTVILALFITGLAFPMASIPEIFDTLFSLFWLAFASGYGANSAIIEVSEYLT